MFQFFERLPKEEKAACLVLALVVMGLFARAYPVVVKVHKDAQALHEAKR